ncbi:MULTISPECIES: hypothetical protein [unclassified Streptomyces]|uniref:hypothetical protein n=1 Tax=unclassified Streptomyces TaxID=2593676 RepID=UPI00115F8FD4|nr:MULTISPECIES: hypothetical protein [unclassified Streptomyces]MDX2733396.1 hypothetical protein [Streptomyces sp. PA03-2a]MDX3771641.1 hypothetical protein [Streptomyces sp. AK08-01B]MDX3821278.1 hypothetical protein [Streptomyces sp. AK08-01A]
MNTQTGLSQLPPAYVDARRDLSGKTSRSYSDGTYKVKAKPGTADNAIGPGTYRAKGDPADRCWERTSFTWSILGNVFRRARFMRHLKAML